MLPWQLRVNQLRDHWCTPLAATNPDFENWFTIVRPDDSQADVVELDGCSVLKGSTHRDLELPWQKGEFRMEGRPLSYEFTIGPGVFDLVSRDASNSHFVLLDFVNSGRPAQPAAQLRAVPLKPCIYKRR